MNYPPPLPISVLVKPATDRSYLLFCPEQGGWQIGEWWTVDGPGRWVAVIDSAYELHPSHVLAPPPAPMNEEETLDWIRARQGR